MINNFINPVNEDAYENSVIELFEGMGYAYRLENGVFVDLGLTIELPDSTEAGVKYKDYTMQLITELIRKTMRGYRRLRFLLRYLE